MIIGKVRTPIRRGSHLHLLKINLWSLRYTSSYAEETEEQPRINAVGIQYLSHSLHKQIFRNKDIKDELFNKEEKQNLIGLSKQMLKTHGLLGKKTNISKPITFELPELQGNLLDEHFQRLGHFASEPYKSMCDSKFKKIVARPKEWLRKPGWYRYEPGKDPISVSYPEEDMLVFDVEVLYKISHYPTLAVALSDSAWYLWCSPYICNVPNNEDVKHLIPLNTLEKPKVVIGHNVGYDRSKVLEEYNLLPSKAFFLDTMSLHVASSGMCSRQRPVYMKKQKRDKEMADLAAENDELVPVDDVDEDNPWLSHSSTNSLRDVANFHCNIKISKDAREMFATLDKNEIIDNFQDMAQYCSTDVEVTSKVFDAVFPKFVLKCPHPVSFGALRFISSTILPTRVDKWENYLESAETLFQQSKSEIEDKIIEIVEDIVKLKDTPEKYEDDPWLKQLDWTMTPIKYTKSGELRKNQKLPGFPEWYRSLFANKTETRPQVTIRTRSVPLFFKLSWEDCPVVWTTAEGWCFRADDSRIEELKAKNYIMAREVNIYFEDNTTLFKIPHPNGPDFNCTTLLSKPFIHYFEKGILKSGSELAHEALQTNASGAYWMSARERIMSQHVVPEKDFKTEFKGKASTTDNEELGIILPKLIPMGTVTRRSVENTWLTASNAKSNRIGSELKCNVVAPPGYTFVGADVDSEELWIASLVGDSIFDIHGGTAIGWMCLEGTKNEGTDLHSKTAEILGCTRNEAKIFNYGRIYGAGVKFASQLLKKFNPSLTDQETRKTAERLYESTKGRTQRSRIFKKFWYGGSESVLFNKLESIAEQDEPKTPVLAAGITFSLMRKNLGTNSFLPSRINWVIQSSGVDYLHILCCSMNYLIEKYSIDARLMISIHDEIRYLVAEKDKYRLALALQVSNIWTRAFFSEQMCINDLPQNCAFFSAVDIDSVMRKEVDMDCITPSNKMPIPHGESLDIHQILAITGGNLGKPSEAVQLKQFPYKYREPIFKQQNRRYSKEFLKYSLTMQIQDAKWKVQEMETEYMREIEESNLQHANDSAEYNFGDYLNDLKQKKTPKRSIMSDTVVYGGIVNSDTSSTKTRESSGPTRSSSEKKYKLSLEMQHQLTNDPSSDVVRNNFKRISKQRPAKQIVNENQISDLVMEAISTTPGSPDTKLRSRAKKSSKAGKGKIKALQNSRKHLEEDAPVTLYEESAKLSSTYDK